jgi:SAM-dependent methyltransferase
MLMTPEMETLKTRLKAMWMAGDYGHFATYLLPGAMEFLTRLGVGPGTRMLDVGCGAGQIAIPAAHAGAQVTGIDIASNLIEQARARATAEGVDAQFEEGDAEMLSCKDAAYDLVVSLIGAMFAPRPECVASELVRACRPGGRIAMANWTPGGFVGQMFKIIGRHVPPPPLMASPVKWGDEATVRERLRDGIADLKTTRRLYPMRYPFAPAEVVEFFRAWYGPTNRAFAALDADRQAALRSDLEQLWSEHNQASNGGTVIEAEYLEVVAIRA